MLTSISKWISRVPRLPEKLPTFLLQSYNVEIIQSRGRKRGNKQPTKAQRLARRQKREEKEELKKRFTFMQRVMNINTKRKSISLEGPGRFNPEEDEKLPQTPPYSVYFTQDVRTKFYSIPEALALHRRLQSPEIFGNRSALLKLRMELNMDTERKTKFITGSRQIVVVPYPFKHKEKRTILAFAPDKVMQDQAMAAGADMAVGPEMVKKILKGQFLVEDYDFCVAHQSVTSAIMALRGILKARFPTKINGGIGEDLEEIIGNFLAGTNLVIKPDPKENSWGISDPIVGTLDMPDEHIAANVNALVTMLCNQRNPALGPFINRAALMTFPGEAFFPIDVSEMLPIATEADLDKVEKKKQKKKKKDKEKKEAEEYEKEPRDPLIDLM